MGMYDFFINLSVLDYITVIIVAFLFIMSLRFTFYALKNLRKGSHDKFLSRLIRSLVNLAFFLFIGVIVLEQLGVSDQVIQLIGVVITGIIAFSSTSFILNLMSGMIIHLNEPFKTGHIIKYGDKLAKVINTTSMYTELYTFDKQHISVPNSHFIKEGTINYSKDAFRVSSKIGIAYGINRNDVEGALLKAAETTNLNDIFVTIPKLDQHFVTYEVVGLLKDSDAIPFVESKLNENILDEFMKAGIEIMTPTYIGHKKSSRQVPKRKRTKPNPWKVSQLVKKTFNLEDPVKRPKKLPKK